MNKAKFVEIPYWDGVSYMVDPITGDIVRAHGVARYTREEYDAMTEKDILDDCTDLIVSTPRVFMMERENNNEHE